MSEKKGTYGEAKGRSVVVHETDWDYPDTAVDEDVERYIEEGRVRYRAEWFAYLEDRGVCEQTL